MNLGSYGVLVWGRETRDEKERRKNAKRKNMIRKNID